MAADINQSVRQASRRLAEVFDRAFESVGLKATQVNMLFEIARFSAGDPPSFPSVGDLAIVLSVQVSSVTHALRPLVRDGLVEQWSDSADRRTKHCRLTSAGAERLSASLELRTSANLQVEKVLGRGHAEGLRAIAERVASDEFLLEYQTLSSKRSSGA